MSKKDKDELLPKLRFPEFRNEGPINHKSGNDVFEPISNKKHNADLPVLAITQEHGAIPRDLIDYNVSVTDKSIENYKVVEIGDFIISLRSFQGGIEYSRYNGICSPAYIILRKKIPVFESYYKYYFKTDKFIQELNKDIEGIRDGKMVSYNQFSSLMLPVPGLKEQKKIADCLSVLDELITAEAKKLEALKTHKNGLVQKLLPAVGEIVPKLRFPEFQDSGNWKWIPIRKKADLLSGYAFKSVEISKDASGVPLMRGINITEGFIRHNQDIDRFFLGEIKKGIGKYRLQTNDLVIGMDGSKVGKNSAVITDDDAGSLLVQRVARLRTDSKATISFIFHHINSNKFHSYVDRINTSGGIPHISAKHINDFEICFPPSVKEQQKIADCLSSLDELIITEAQKIETLKAHKKGLMQRLFPHADEVSV